MKTKADIMIHLNLNLLLIFNALTLPLTAAAVPTSPNDMQHPLTENITTSESRTSSSSPSPKQFVPGHNNAYYGPIPLPSQIFDIDFLEIAASPIPVQVKFQIRQPPSLPTN